MAAVVFGESVIARDITSVAVVDLATAVDTVHVTSIQAAFFLQVLLGGRPDSHRRTSLWPVLQPAKAVQRRYKTHLAATSILEIITFIRDMSLESQAMAILSSPLTASIGDKR
jgi:hypothetical protein